MIKVSVYALKPQFQLILEPCLSALKARGVSPNVLTLSGLAFSLVYGVSLFATHANQTLLLLYPLVVFIRMAFNALDGMMAKRYQMQTKTGAFLNELSDLVSDLALSIPFLFFQAINAPIVGAVILCGILCEFVSIAVHSSGGVRSFDGPFGKSDRALYFAILSMACLGGSNPALINILSWTGVLLGTITLFNRLKSVRTLES